MDDKGSLSKSNLLNDDGTLVKVDKCSICGSQLKTTFEQTIGVCFACDVGQNGLSLDHIRNEIIRIINIADNNTSPGGVIIANSPQESVDSKISRIDKVLQGLAGVLIKEMYLIQILFDRLMIAFLYMNSNSDRSMWANVDDLLEPARKQIEETIIKKINESNGAIETKKDQT